MPEDESNNLRRQLESARTEHRDLDDVLHRLAEQPPLDQLQVRRLKKRKLRLKDTIAHLESKLIPDLDA